VDALVAHNPLQPGGPAAAQDGGVGIDFPDACGLAAVVALAGQLDAQFIDEAAKEALDGLVVHAGALGEVLEGDRGVAVVRGLGRLAEAPEELVYGFFGVGMGVLGEGAAVGPADP
jgi:hypothetical protein